MKKLLALLLLTALLMTGCASSYGGAKQLGEAAQLVQPERFNSREYTPYPISKLAYGTLSDIIALDNGKNTLYSPMSLYMALALLADGASGDTAAELYSLLGVSDRDALEAYMQATYDQMYRNDEYSKVIPALSVWADDKISDNIRPEYIERVTDRLAASVFSTDFADKSAGKSISKWISDRTDGMLKPEIQVSADQLMSVISTIYINDQWDIKFDTASTAPGTFHNADGSESTLDFMNMTLDTHYFAVGDGWTRSVLTLKSGARVVFVLPDEDVGIDGLLENADFAEIFEGGEDCSGEVVWKLPKIDYAAGYELSDTIKALGACGMFSADADFSELADTQLFADKVIQESRFSMNENGISAASYTHIMIYGAAVPTSRAEMILDRPFMFMVQSRFGVPMYIGIYMNNK